MNAGKASKLLQTDSALRYDISKRYYLAASEWMSTEAVERPALLERLTHSMQSTRRTQSYGLLYLNSLRPLRSLRLCIAFLGNADPLLASAFASNRPTVHGESAALILLRTS